ncbi:MAG TPA: PQQ-binding-like beta-propeller repeat protein [Solirubrobacteraceae bacterium]
MLAAALAGAPAASAAATCAPDPASPAGGEWPSYGHDLANTRTQDAERTITRANVSTLGPAWTFSSNKVGGKGDFVGTPIVAGGCVFAGTTGGFVYAVNADTGRLVWRVKLPRGEVNNTVAVADGLVYVGVTNITSEPCDGEGCEGPYVVALDQFSGRTVWETRRPLDFQPGADVYGSPVIFDPTPDDPQAAGRAKARRCVSRRRFEIRLRAPKGRRLRSARVFVAGRRVKTFRKGRRLRAVVDLRGLPRGRFTVRVVARTADGKRVRETRIYRTCRTKGRKRRRGRRALHRDTLQLRQDDAILVMGISGWGAEGNEGVGDDRNRNKFQGSVVMLDAASGGLLSKTWTIHPPAQCPSSTCAEPGREDEFAGATVWATPAIDPAEKVAYIPTGNPFKPEAEHANANAVIKVGVDRARPEQFGKVLGSYKGSPEEYLPGLDEVPCADTPTVLYGCVELDLDFGASPNLITLPGGRKAVGAGQKSGVYHVFDAKTMERIWTAPFSPPGFLVGGIVGSTAYDGRRVYGPITTGGYLWAADQATGGRAWMAPLNDAAHYGEPVATANGVVYSVDRAGMLDALDSGTGAFLLRRRLDDGTRTEGDVGSYAGTAIARNTVYAAVGTQGNADGYLIAYRLGGKGSPPPDQAPPLPGTDEPEAKDSDPAVVAGPGATSAGFATPVMSIQKGQTLAFRNLDVQIHDVTSKATGPDSRALFRSPRASAGQAVPVIGAEKAPPGQYEFFCSIHPGMTGSLTVR